MAAVSTTSATVSQAVSNGSSPSAENGQGFSYLPQTAQAGVSALMVGSETDELRRTALRKIQNILFAAPLPGCATVSGNSVTYNNCDLQGGTMNGNFTANNGHLTWDITAMISGGTGTLNWHMTGDITITADHVSGFGLIDYDFTMGITYHLRVDLDLGFTGSPEFCINSGTMVASRSLTGAPANTPGLNNAAFRVTWTGCGMYTAANSMP